MARQWLTSLGTPENVSLVPGNHDAYVRGALVEASHAWAPYMFGDHAAGFPYLRRRGPLALIGLSSAVSTAWGMASGRLGGAQIRALAEMLEALKREGLFRVVLIHHPPVSAAKWHKLLRDAGAAQARDRRARRRASAARPRSSRHAQLAQRTRRRARAGGRACRRLPPRRARPRTRRRIISTASTARRGAWTCEMVSRGIDAGGEVSELKRMMLR